MPKRTDIKKILIIGAGPIVIGQACEFDYSGVQACKALKEEGYEIVLVNSNPATIMTDPEMAHRTYIEPITPMVVEKIIERERPDALLPTMGGQTALNTAVALAESGALKKYQVELIGAKRSESSNCAHYTATHAPGNRISARRFSPLPVLRERVRVRAVPRSTPIGQPQPRAYSTPTSTANAAPHRHPQHPHHRLGSDRHRPGL